MRLLNRILLKNKNKDIDFFQIETEALPKHVAIILDGNGRWAKQKGWPRSAGHKAGVERVRTVIRMSSDIGIKVLTLFAFSTENWKRPKDEISTLMTLLSDYLRQESDELNKRNVRICTLGEISRLPNDVVTEIMRAKDKTKDNTGLTVNMALNYGSRAEILRAVKMTAKSVKDGKLKTEDIDDDYFSGCLYTKGQIDPDLIIRTSGEKRISNFLLYQMAYSEFYFADVFWPAFDEKEYIKALIDYQNRKRRYGGI